MTLQLIDIGLAPGDGLGDPARTAFTKANAAITQLNAQATQIFYIDSEATLLQAAPLNGSNQHVLAPDTAYNFGPSFSHANPILWNHKTTECFGGGIGQTTITYTGTGNQHIINNGSFRSRFMQWHATTTTGIQVAFTGAGSGTGTNVSLDRTYLVCPLGQALDVTSCDFFFTSAAVIVSPIPVHFHGLDCGIFAAELTLLQGSVAGNLLDFNGCKFQDIIGSSLLFEGPAGAVAIAGQTGNANVEKSASFAGCPVAPGVIPTSGIDPSDTKYNFQGNPGIPDSVSACFAYIDPDAETTIQDGTFVQLAGTWNLSANSSRVVIDPIGEIEFLNAESALGQVTCSISCHKVSGGGSADYHFELEKSTDGGTVWVAVEGMTKDLTLTASASQSITWTGLVDHVAGDKFRVTAAGDATTTNIVAESGQIVIGR